MNIFILDTDIETCARYHCDAHVSKMILESVQILCTALNTRGIETPYKSTHKRHPCVLWAGKSYDNFSWLVQLARALNSEYRYRYQRERDHASIAVLREIESARFANEGRTEFVQAMPDRFKVPGDAVSAYRNFYLGEKSRFAKWTRRPDPPWWDAKAITSLSDLAET
ncbi:MAG TPA: pyrimidine dimer DNA glycosylase/endonuclease V [Xanthomonadales bacterium]|nr:pyrimidine dimer DNA glycosylase/endonuclease V [Xanthomonadales bacterium]